MNIKSFQLTSATDLDLDLTVTAPVLVLCGRYSDGVLDLLRELVGGCRAEGACACLGDGQRVIHADVEMDGRTYDVCYIRNADAPGEGRVAVGFKAGSTEYSSDATVDFLRRCAARNQSDVNVIDLRHLNARDGLPACRHTIAAFRELVGRIPEDDDRPVFLYGLFDRLDAAADVTPCLERLASLSRQVIVSVCASYPTERLERDGVQISGW